MNFNVVEFGDSLSQQRELHISSIAGWSDGGDQSCPRPSRVPRMAIPDTHFVIQMYRSSHANPLTVSRAMTTVFLYQPIPPRTMADKQTFQILRIFAHSDHPVRNSAGELIFGNHVLWEGDNANDGDAGSIAPNVFSYDFKSPLASNSLLNITLKVNGELSGSDCCLSGALGGSNVFESDIFSVSSGEEVIIAARVVEPHTSPSPLALNGDFAWTLEQKGSDRKLACAAKTRLELYWVAAKIHEIFLSGLSGIEIDFLRYAFPRVDPDTKTATSGAEVHSAALTLAMDQVTQQVFSNYSKVYDTFSGAPHFVAGKTGGFFNYSYYVKAAPGGPPGSLSRDVNCYDQAAMVQVLAGFGKPPYPNWLVMEPYGYINQTYLVGVNGLCNNPFFNNNHSPSLIGINDTRRTGFGNHVFNGLLFPFKPQDPKERIFDACAGPSLGTLDPYAYVNAAVDSTTTLTAWKRVQWPTSRVTKVLPASVWLPLTWEKTKMTTKMMEFLEKCTVGNAKPYSQIRWTTNIGERVAERLWHLTGVDGIDSDVVVRVRAEHRSPRTETSTSKNPLRRHLTVSLSLSRISNSILAMTTTVSALCMRPAPFDDFAHYALQYASHIAKGRFLIASGNHMITISGGSSSAALEPIARKLLTHTTVDSRLSRHIPVVPKWSYDIPEISKGSSDETVAGVGSTFNVKCHVDDLVGRPVPMSRGTDCC
ncbi:hypothetical protein LshimejAT787_0201470 [Lyophyllum shimeji]|uniref:Uncharacterized protein n=1 Tax=Lyophyllum shimeji TaxID=47721 RepID=A0A9P3PEQ4_LYOSH|nr:hypothetical protein LshimejAT787_0201470 [Lyophyllum shimeji]